MPNTTSAQKTLRFYPVNQSGMKGGSRKAYTIIHPRLIPISQPQWGPPPPAPLLQNPHQKCHSEAWTTALTSTDWSSPQHRLSAKRALGRPRVRPLPPESQEQTLTKTLPSPSGQANHGKVTRSRLTRSEGDRGQPDQVFWSASLSLCVLNLASIPDLPNPIVSLSLLPSLCLPMHIPFPFLLFAWWSLVVIQTKIFLYFPFHYVVWRVQHYQLCLYYNSTTSIKLSLAWNMLFLIIRIK